MIGGDTFSIEPRAATFGAALTVDGNGGGTDAVTIAGNRRFGTRSALTVDAETITVTAGVTVGAGASRSLPMPPAVKTVDVRRRQRGLLGKRRTKRPSITVNGTIVATGAVDLRAERRQRRHHVRPRPPADCRTITVGMINSGST